MEKLKEVFKKYWWVFLLGAGVLVLLYIRSRNQAAPESSGDQAALQGAYGASAPASYDFAGAIADLQRQISQQNAQNASAGGAAAASPNNFPSSQLGPGQTVSPTGQIQLAPGSQVVAGGGGPSLLGAANVPAVYSAPSGQCAPGESRAVTPDGRVLCGGNYAGGTAPSSSGQSLQQPQQSQQPVDTHAAPPGTTCPPGQHWSYNERQCRGNVNIFNDYLAPLVSAFTGFSRPSMGAIGTTGIAGPVTMASPNVSNSSGQTDVFGKPIVQAASIRRQGQSLRGSLGHSTPMVSEV